MIKKKRVLYDIFLSWISFDEFVHGLLYGNGDDQKKKRRSVFFNILIFKPAENIVIDGAQIYLEAN